MKNLTAILPVIIFLVSGTAFSKTLLENCAANKLKEYKIKNLVAISEEAGLLRRFRAECAKYTFTTPSEKQTLAAEAQAAERQARLDKEAKDTKDKKAAIANPPVTKQQVPTPSAVVTPAPVATGSSQAVIGGCGSPEQCAAYMKEASTPKYTWSSPGLQVYLGELWGNSFDYYYGLGGTFEQPKDACNESNQGKLIGLDLGTEVIAVSCMSSFATQEEVKKMAGIIKNTKVETLMPYVLAVKKPQYQWKEIKKPKTIENDQQFCICMGPGSCGSHNLGQESSGDACCPVLQCIRIDGGEVKPTPKPNKDKDFDKPKDKDQPAPKPEFDIPRPVNPNPPPVSLPPPSGYDRERDGAAGP